jgi:hypothetical protein
LYSYALPFSAKLYKYKAKRRVSSYASISLKIMKALKILTVFLLLLAVISESAEASTVDNFQIYIKKVLRMNDSGFGSYKNGIKLLVLAKAFWGDTLAINFNHCTAGAQQRRIKIMTESNKVIFKWTFPDKDIERLMQKPIKQLLSFIQPNVKAVLYYFDEQVSDGYFLTTLESKGI